MFRDSFYSYAAGIRKVCTRLSILVRGVYNRLSWWLEICPDVLGGSGSMPYLGRFKIWPRDCDSSFLSWCVFLRSLTVPGTNFKDPVLLGQEMCEVLSLNPYLVGLWSTFWLEPHVFHKSIRSTQIHFNSCFVFSCCTLVHGFPIYTFILLLKRLFGSRFKSVPYTNFEADPSKDFRYCTRVRSTQI